MPGAGTQQSSTQLTTAPLLITGGRIKVPSGVGKLGEVGMLMNHVEEIKDFHGAGSTVIQNLAISGMYCKVLESVVGKVLIKIFL